MFYQVIYATIGVYAVLPTKYAVMAYFYLWLKQAPKVVEWLAIDSSPTQCPLKNKSAPKLKLFYQFTASKIQKEDQLSQSKFNAHSF